MSEEKSRKELLEEPDPFLVFVGKAMDFGKKYQKEIVGTVGALVAVIIVITGVLYYKNQTEDRAAAMLGKTIARYDAVKKDESSFVALEEVKKEFKGIIDKYGSTDAGKSALMMYADVCYQTKNYDDALKAYKQALDAMGKTPFKSMILNGLAYACEGKEDYEQAADWFKKIASDETAVLRDQALFNLGRMYGKLGKPEQEKETLQQLVSEFPDSMYADLAGEKIAG
jgi:tetratricopeptide (TPR) repeat protein